jgi:thiamine-phosphate pyrophosphorylase
MNLSGDAKLLWDAAVALDRAVAAVSTAGTPTRVRPPLLFFTDPARTPEPLRTAKALPPGAGVVYRAFGVADASDVARRLREVTADQGVRLLIGLDADLAERVGADGLHLPERALGSATMLRDRHPDWLLTGAVHSAAAVRTAPPSLDALVLSPLFRAGGASSGKAALGVEAFAAIARASALPVYALGGIGPAMLGGLAETGACGVAAVDAIQTAFGAED